MNYDLYKLSETARSFIDGMECALESVDDFIRDIINQTQADDKSDIFKHLTHLSEYTMKQFKEWLKEYIDGKIVEIAIIEKGGAE